MKEIRVKPLDEENKNGKMIAYIFLFQPILCIIAAVFMIFMSIKSKNNKIEREGFIKLRWTIPYKAHKKSNKISNRKVILCLYVHNNTIPLPTMVMIFLSHSPLSNKEAWCKHIQHSISAMLYRKTL